MSFLLISMLTFGCATTKSQGDGVPVKVYVLDDGGKPIPTAVV